MTSTTNIKTNYDFKILSMLGMLFVLFGHFGCSYLKLGGLYEYDSFHVPLFIFISGYFYNQKNNQTIKSVGIFIKKKVIHLLIPYFAWTIIYGVIGYIIQLLTSFQICEPGQFKASTLFLDAFKRSSGFIYNVAAWFLMALFLVQIANVLLRFVFDKIFGRFSTIIYFAFTFVFAYIALLYSFAHPEINWSLTWRRTAYLLFYYALGQIYKLYIEKVDEKVHVIVALLINVAIQGAMFYFFGNHIIVCIDMIFPTTGMPAIYYFVRAILGIHFWLRIAKILAPLIGANKMVLYIANHTFSLMMHQGFIGLFVNGLIIVLFRKYELLEPYKIYIWFNTLPSPFTFVVPILVGIIILLLVRLWDYVFAFVSSKIKSGNTSHI